MRISTNLDQESMRDAPLELPEDDEPKVEEPQADDTKASPKLSSRKQSAGQNIRALFAKNIITQMQEAK